MFQIDNSIQGKLLFEPPNIHPVTVASLESEAYESWAHYSV